MQFPTLYKTAAKKNVKWDVKVEKVSDSESVIVIEFGTIGGKQTVTNYRITAGKNIGKSNETTPHEQACAEAQARWVKKKEREGYDENLSSSAEKVAVKPMLALEYTKHSNKVDWSSPVFVQPKLDGHRCLAVKTDSGIELWSRKQKLITTVPHLNEELGDLIRTGDVLDGELYIHGYPLGKIGSLISRKSDESAKMCYHVYDFVHQEPFSNRLEMLKDRLASDLTALHVVPTLKVENTVDMMEKHDLWVADGYEGAILRHGVSGYLPGRRTHYLLKLKTFVDEEFEITGYKEGKGKYEGLAIFIMVTKDGHSFEAIAPGTVEEKRKAWEERESYIGKWMTVKYQYMTKTEKPVPFLPVAKCLREDV